MKHAIEKTARVGFAGLGGRSVRVLAHGAEGRKWLAQSQGRVYWSLYGDGGDGGKIVVLDKEGAIIPTDLATGLYMPGHAIVAGAHVIWSEPSRSGVPYRQAAGRIARVSVDGGSVEVLAEGQDHPGAVAAREGRLAWVEDRDYERANIVVMDPGGLPRRIASDQTRTLALTLSDEHVYWVSVGDDDIEYQRGTLQRAALDGGPQVEVLAEGLRMPRAVVVDATHIYWADGPLAFDSRPGVAYRMPLRGGPPEDLCEAPGIDGFHIALDDERLYLQPYASASIFRAAKSGGDASVIVEHDDTLVRTQSMVVDDRCVYWSTLESRGARGAIFRTPK